MDPVDFMFLVLGFVGVWQLIEMRYILKQIWFELNPKKKPLKRQRHEGSHFP